jgi:hypothetical protein
MNTVKTPFNLVIASILLVILICGCTQNQNEIKSPIVSQTTSEATTPEAGQKWLTYDNPEAGIKMKYPVEWNVNLIPNNYNESHPGEYILLLRFDPDSNDPSINQTARVIVSATDVSTDPYAGPYDLDNKLYLLKRDYPNHEILEASSNYTLSSNPAYRVIHIGKPKIGGEEFGEDEQLMEIGTTKNKWVYTFLYSAPKDKYSKYLNTINEMVDSFTIT